jgi:hypothetical protein
MRNYSRPPIPTSPSIPSKPVAHALKRAVFALMRTRFYCSSPDGSQIWKVQPAPGVDKS